MRAGYLAEFRTADEMVGALRALRKKGYRRVDAFSPYPVKGVDEALGLPRSPAGRMLFPMVFGAAGLGFLVQLWCNAYAYPLNVGGRPLNSAPSFVPNTFETGVITAGVAGLILLCMLCRLPDVSAPLFAVPGFERTAIDGFWVGVDERDPSFNEHQVPVDLRALGALRVSRAKAHEEES